MTWLDTQALFFVPSATVPVLLVYKIAMIGADDRSKIAQISSDQVVPQLGAVEYGAMRIFLFVLAATVLEAAGDAIVRIALHRQSPLDRIGLFLVGYILLALYGTSLNLAPIEFAAVTGIYVATLFVVFQIVNFVFFRVLPTPAVLVGGAFIVIGGFTVALWR